MRLAQFVLMSIVILTFSGQDNSKLQTNYNESTTPAISKDSIVHYLALGDSYTAGTSVRNGKSFPSQLSDCLQKELQKEVKLEVIAEAGWRTDELLNILMFGALQNSYDFITLCIGVNNQYQKKGFGQYKKEFPKLLKQAIKLTKGSSDRVFVISIPDWSYTPFGEKDGRKNISKEINKYNVFAKKIAEEYKVSFISITDLSREGLKDTNLVAKDGLHPSGRAYKQYVERLCPKAVNMFK